MANKPSGADQWRLVQADAIRDAAMRLVFDPQTSPELLIEARAALKRPSSNGVPIPNLALFSPRMLAALAMVRAARDADERGETKPANALPESTITDDDEPDPTETATDF